MSDAHYHALVNAIEDCAIFMLDLNGRITSWNTGARKIKGYQAHEIIGQHLSRFYTAESVARGWPEYELKQAYATGRFEDEGWRVRKDGSLFWANVVITAARNTAGEIIGYAKYTRDLTAKRAEEEKLRLSEERFRLLVESVSDYAIFMLDPDGHIASWNTGAMRIKGYRPQDVLGKHFSIFYCPEDIVANVPETELQTAIRTGRVENEGWRVRKDGSLFWANVVITAVYDERRVLRGFAKVTRDMSERKRLEQLEVSSRRISEFLATLAHELRNPLAPVRNAIGVMQMEPEVTPRVAACRDIIDRQTSHLGRLVDDLLDMGRITTGKIDLRVARADISDIIARSIELVRPFTDDRAQVIAAKLPDEPVQVMGDSTRLVQVVQNLLNNASKFSPHASTITVVVECEASAMLIKERHRTRHIAKRTDDDLRPVRAGGSLPQPGRGGPRHRAHAMPFDRRAARRIDLRGERRRASGQHVHGAPALRFPRRRAAAPPRARAERGHDHRRRPARDRHRRQPRLRRQHCNAAAVEGP
jgi:PAS domain S-box-containing protein